ncbi:MAG: WYL domain-containing protein [Clostridiales bacterium]|nr:WYL domain-containing protein [Clostridiales bacterium]
MSEENKEVKESGKSEKKKVNRKARKLNATEKTILLLEYLKKSTDENHKVKSIGKIREYFNDKKINIGNNKTVNTLIKKVANAYNTNLDESLIPESEWRIVFDDYSKKYGEQPIEEFEGESEEEEYDTDEMKIKNLYYAHEFSHEDIDALVEAVLFSRTIAAKDADRIIKTLTERFASEHYGNKSLGICKIHEKSNYDKELLRNNIKIIQQAIEKNVQIEYKFNGYSHDGKIRPMRDYIRVASPYYIVADNGKYYLLAANDTYKNTMTIRIDLMTDVSLAVNDKKADKKGVPRIPIDEVKGMPKSWDDNFSYRHIKMAYDSPERITLRVKSEKSEQGKHIDPDYTFLHDNFGDTYVYRGVDKQDSDYDIVEVRCSPFGIVSMAMQYAEKMEILEPAYVREMAQEKARVLCEKYLGD